MNKKRIVFFVTIALILTGCTKITNNYDEIIDTTMKKNNMTTNTVSTGYELYVPMGVMQIKDSQYNQIFKIKNRYVYLYIDTVSYYYKNTLECLVFLQLDLSLIHRNILQGFSSKLSLSLNKRRKHVK